jgi:hypothetical protein
VTYSRTDVPNPKLGRHAIIPVHGPPINDSCRGRARIEKPYDIVRCFWVDLMDLKRLLIMVSRMYRFASSWILL